MLEYTVACFIFLILLAIFDIWIVKTKMLFKPRFWVFLGLVIILQTIVDNYLNGRWFFNEPIVGPYNPQFYLGIKIWHTPLENYLFGVGLVGLNVVLFEYFITKFKIKKSITNTINYE